MTSSNFGTAFRVRRLLVAAFVVALALVPYATHAVSTNGTATDSVVQLGTVAPWLPFGDPGDLLGEQGLVFSDPVGVASPLGAGSTTSGGQALGVSEPTLPWLLLIATFAIALAQRRGRAKARRQNLLAGLACRASQRMSNVQPDEQSIHDAHGVARSAHIQQRFSQASVCYREEGRAERGGRGGCVTGQGVTFVPHASIESKRRKHGARI